MRTVKNEVGKFEEKEDEYKREIEDLLQEKEKEAGVQASSRDLDRKVQ